MNATREEWRPIPGYEGRYEASDRGRIRSLDRTVVYKDGRTRFASGIILKLSFRQSDGRGMVALGFQNSQYVHQLVAAAFYGPCPIGLEVCHNDGDCRNNSAENLRYDTHSENEYDQVRHGVHQQASKTHCPAGHEYDYDNTYRHVTKEGFNHRTCRICKREGTRRARANGATW